MKKSNRGFDMDNEYKNQDEEQENSLETSNQAELNDEKADDKERELDSYGEPIENPDDDEEPKKKKIKGVITELIIYAAIIIMCVCVVPKYVLQRTIVDGTSMMNTLSDGDNLLVEKVTYRISDPKRFDVIVFYPHGRQSNDYYIKRVIGLPGEMVIIKDGLVYINGSEVPLEEPYAHGVSRQDFGPYLIPADCYFVLGDNRDNSKDSRYWKNTYVTKKQIIAKALFRYNNGFKIIE